MLENTIGSGLSQEEIKEHERQMAGLDGKENLAREEDPDKLLIEQNLQPHWDLPTEIPDLIIKALEETGSYDELESIKVWNAIRSGSGSVLTANPRGWQESYEMIKRALDEVNPQDWAETCREMRHTFLNERINIGLTEKSFPYIKFEEIQTPEQAQGLVEWAKSQIDLLPEIDAFSERFEEQVKRFDDKPDQEQQEEFAEMDRIRQEITNIARSKIDQEEKLSQLIPLTKQLEALEHIPWYTTIACYRRYLRDKESGRATFERDLDLSPFERELYNSAVDVAGGMYNPDDALVTRSLENMKRRIESLIQRKEE